MLRQQTFDRDRIRLVAGGFLLLAGWIVVRLFILQIWQHNYFALFALNSHELSKKLHPERGVIYFQDSRSKKEYPAAINKDFYLLYGVPKEISIEAVASTSAAVADILGITLPVERKIVLEKLSKSSDPYETLARKVDDATAEKIKAANLPGIYANAEKFRFYPEQELAGNLLGFTGSDEHGTVVGRYGLEGFLEKTLAGKTGYIAGEKGALGSLITLANRTEIQAENGADVLLTIDRSLEFKACERLRQGMKEYEAKSASLVLLNPKTGAIRAMCSLPDFDPNVYSKVSDPAAYNNTTIFTPYEPGSVFKSFTMAAGVDAGLISPTTVYTDPCEMKINGFTVRNAERKCYGLQTMTQVLENSVNTGVVWVEDKLGNERFKNYIEKFGFGAKTGVALNTEAAGDISSLGKKGQIFGANGSFGQGLTATPLQIAVAYGAIAHEGKLMRPFIAEEVRYGTGRREKTQPEVMEEVLSPRTAKLVGGMLVSVVENHYKAAKIPAYYVAGKTGTAQIAEKGSYSAERTNHTFAGFAPATSPELVLVVKFEEPNKQWAEQTALPVFRDVMKFALDYYGVPGDR